MLSMGSAAWMMADIRIDEPQNAHGEFFMHLHARWIIVRCLWGINWQQWWVVAVSIVFDECTMENRVMETIMF